MIAETRNALKKTNKIEFIWFNKNASSFSLPLSLFFSLSGIVPNTGAFLFCREPLFYCHTIDRVTIFFCKEGCYCSLNVVFTPTYFSDIFPCFAITIHSNVIFPLWWCTTDSKIKSTSIICFFFLLAVCMETA